MEIVPWNDTRNLRDCYKGMDESDITFDRMSRSLPFYVALMNLTSDFNKSSAIRNANNFLAAGAVIVGDKHWDRRGAVGSHNYMFTTHVTSLLDLSLTLPEYRFVALENSPDATPIAEYQWEPNTVMVFGEEQRGLSPEEFAYCDDIVSIPTMGTVRSINVAVASGIAMYDYCVKQMSLV